MRVHFAILTKYRRDVLPKEILDNMRSIFASVRLDFESELAEFDGKDDIYTCW